MITILKTRAAILAIQRFFAKNPKGKVEVVVPTEHLKVQWMIELNKFNLVRNVSVEIINTAVKNKEKISFLILDEVHRIPAESFFEVFVQKNPIMVLGLSATFERLDGKHELLKQYCPIVDVITVKEAVLNKWLSPYKEYKVLLEVDDIAVYRQHNEDFLNAFSVFNFDFNLAMKCLTNIISRRAYAKYMKLSVAEIDAITYTWNRSLKARKDFVMNHPKKVEIANKILSYRYDKKAITFSATIKQAEKIKVGNVVHSGKTKKKNRVTIEEFNRIKCGCINTAKSLDEGADIRGLNLAIILCNTSSATQKTQRVGRVIRYEEGKEAEVFTLVIKGTNEEGWFQTSTNNQNYIEINEAELDLILSGKELPVVEQQAIATDFLFRV